MDYWTHTLQAGDRWDLIAYQYYGDAGQIEPLVTLNTHLPLDGFLPPGETLYIPDIISPDPEEINDTVPPWKRTS